MSMVWSVRRVLALGAMAGPLWLPLPALAQVTDISGLAGLFDKVLTIQPIQVCNTSGTSCPSMPIYENRLIRTLAQAGIATAVLPSRSVFDTSLNGSDHVDAFNMAGLGKSSNRNTLNAWFVDELTSTETGKTTFGLGYVDGNGVAINSSAVTRFGRQDTFVHEVGHNLGLNHETYGAGAADNLMTEGDKRSSPAMGLTQAQIDWMRGSPFLVAAPVATLDYLHDPQASLLTYTTLKFVSAPSDVRLLGVTIDLPDFVQEVPRQLPASFEAQVRYVEGTVPDANISYVENMVTLFRQGGASETSSTFGGPEVVITFGTGGMAVGDELSFEMGVVGNLRGEYSYDIGRNLAGATIDFIYDFGLTSRVVALDSGSTTDSRAMVAIGPSTATPAAFGVQLLPGEIGPTGPIHFDPVAVPEPATVMLMLAGGLLLGWRRHNGSPIRQTALPCPASEPRSRPTPPVSFCSAAASWARRS